MGQIVRFYFINLFVNYWCLVILGSHMPNLMGMLAHSKGKEFLLLNSDLENLGKKKRERRIRKWINDSHTVFSSLT